MKFTINRTALASITCLGLAACNAPTLVSLQPIGAPQPTNAQQTFVDADGCSWWIIGNGSELRWAPMTNSAGEHVCDGGATRFDAPGTAAPASASSPEQPQDTFAQELQAVLGDPDETAAVPITEPQLATTPSQSRPLTDGKSFYVQVATFARENNAIASEKLFRSLGFEIDSGADIRDSDRLFRLILGPFKSSDEAQKAVERAFNEGFDDAFPFRK